MGKMMVQSPSLFSFRQIPSTVSSIILFVFTSNFQQKTSLFFIIYPTLCSAKLLITSACETVQSTLSFIYSDSHLEGRPLTLVPLIACLFVDTNSWHADTHTTREQNYSASSFCSHFKKWRNAAYKVHLYILKRIPCPKLTTQGVECVSRQGPTGEGIPILWWQAGISVSHPHYSWNLSLTSLSHGLTFGRQQMSKCISVRVRDVIHQRDANKLKRRHQSVSAAGFRNVLLTVQTANCSERDREMWERISRILWCITGSLSPLLLISKWVDWTWWNIVSCPDHQSKRYEQIVTFVWAETA